MLYHEDGGTLTTEPLLSTSPPPPPTKHQHQNVFLSFPLCISYGCIGMIMSLPSTALLYYVNTYIAIPVSLLPLYLSISFLPYSLKPSYAYISTLLMHYNLPQKMQMIFLLLMCGISYVITAFIPQHALVLCFLLAFARSITLAWPNFLLDLCLLDEVDEILLSLKPPIPPQVSSPFYAEVAATFQSQAATYRSMGCVMANIFALLLFAVPILLPHDKKQPHFQESNGIVNHKMFQSILICTGILNFICAKFLWNGTCSTTERQQSSIALFSSIPGNDQSSDSLILRSNNAELASDGPVRLEMKVGLQSYDSLEESLVSPENGAKLSHNGGVLEMNTWIIDSEPLLFRHDTKNTSDTHNNDANPFPMHLVSSTNLVNSDNANSMTHENSHLTGSSIWLVVSLQLLVVSLTMRQSMIQNFTSRIGWTFTVTILTGLFFFSVYTVSLPLRAKADLNETSTIAPKQQQGQQVRVGLYLILRNAIPSVSYLMSSYLYTAFKERPSIIQMLSLLDMCVTTVACHTYSKYLSQYSSGKQLLWLIAITTVLSGLSSFGNVLLIRLLNPNTSTQQRGDSYSMIIKIACTIVINAIIGFFNEWKFFPDVVLATISTNDNNTMDMSLSNVTTTATSLRERARNGTSSDDTFRPIESNPTVGLIHDNDDCNASTCAKQNIAQASSLSSPGVRSVRYGTLLSCIDFGDQIGLLLAGPLIAIFHTTRSDTNNDDTVIDHWHHLEILQIINSIMILLSTLLVFILTVRRSENSTTPSQMPNETI